MSLLDTDTLSLLFAAHSQVTEHFEKEQDEVATTIITRIEMLEGRFASVLKAADGQKLLQAHQRLRETEYNLTTLPIVPLDSKAAMEFDKLRQNKKLKKIGRKDLLIASIALANQTTLVTRNTKHFVHVAGLKLENWAD